MDISRRAQLDTLLHYGAEALDLTPTQYEDAVQKYQAVGAWLNKPDSLLAVADPLVYPQGSIAIGTATKPVGRDEFDLDLVCQMQIGDSISPAQLKRAIGQRLRENAVYHERLEEKNRCWRIIYAGDFYMDILPGRPDPRFVDNTALLIPDKELSAWKESDPKGYAAWFTERSRLSVLASKGMRAGVEAPPPAPNASTKTRSNWQYRSSSVTGFEPGRRRRCSDLDHHHYARGQSVFGTGLRLRHAPAFTYADADVHRDRCRWKSVVSNSVNRLKTLRTNGGTTRGRGSVSSIGFRRRATS